MARKSFLFGALMIFLTFLKLISLAMAAPADCGPIQANDTDRVQFAMNLEFLEAEFFLHAVGKGLDTIAPYLTLGGPPPIGARKANLDPLTHNIVEQFGYQEVGHLRAIYQRIGGIRRPQLDLSSANFAKIMNEAVGLKLIPPFDPYCNPVNYLLACYLIPYVGEVGYVGTIPYLETKNAKSLVAGLLGVESGQDAVIRTLLYEMAYQKVHPYELTVAEFTNAISGLRNRLAKCGIKDEGLAVPLWLGAENRTGSNILSADANSITYARTPQEILRIVYGSGNESAPGGFFPKGGGGTIAKYFLKRA